MPLAIASDRRFALERLKQVAGQDEVLVYHLVIGHPEPGLLDRHRFLAP